MPQVRKRRGLTIQEACRLVPGSCWVPGPDFLEVLTDDAIKESAYVAFYRWLIANRDAPLGACDFHRMHNLVVVGIDTMKYLNAREAKRLRWGWGLRGEKLKRAVSMSDFNAGPQTLVNWDRGGVDQRILGNVVLIRLDLRDDKKGYEK